MPWRGYFDISLDAKRRGDFEILRTNSWRRKRKTSARSVFVVLYVIYTAEKKKRYFFSSLHPFRYDVSAVLSVLLLFFLFTTRKSSKSLKNIAVLTFCRCAALVTRPFSIRPRLAAFIDSRRILIETRVSDCVYTRREIATNNRTNVHDFSFFSFLFRGLRDN